MTNSYKTIAFTEQHQSNKLNPSIFISIIYTILLKSRFVLSFFFDHSRYQTTTSLNITALFSIAKSFHFSITFVNNSSLVTIRIAIPPYSYQYPHFKSL